MQVGRVKQSHVTELLHAASSDEFACEKCLDSFNFSH